MCALNVVKQDFAFSTNEAGTKQRGHAALSHCKDLLIGANSKFDIITIQHFLLKTYTGLLKISDKITESFSTQLSGSWLEEAKKNL